MFKKKTHTPTKNASATPHINKRQYSNQTTEINETNKRRTTSTTDNKSSTTTKKNGVCCKLRIKCKPTIQVTLMNKTQQEICSNRIIIIIQKKHKNIITQTKTI